MNNIIEIISTYYIELIIGLVIGLFISILLNLINLIKVRLVKKQFNLLSQGMTGINLEELLINTSNDLNGIKGDIIQLDSNIQSLGTKLTFAIQKVGFIRYNAFGDMGSDLSFSIAFLDNFSTGFVITSIYGRDSNVCYAKPIKQGKSNIALSAEEIMVIDRAIKGEIFEKSI